MITCRGLPVGEGYERGEPKLPSRAAYGRRPPGRRPEEGRGVLVRGGGVGRACGRGVVGLLGGRTWGCAGGRADGCDRICVGLGRGAPSLGDTRRSSVGLPGVLVLGASPGWGAVRCGFVICRSVLRSEFLPCVDGCCVSRCGVWRVPMVRVYRIGFDCAVGR